MAKLKLNKVMIKKMEKIIKAGNYDKVAIDLCGITAETFYNWMNKGEDDYYQGRLKTLYAEFFISIKKARAEGEKSCLNIIKKDKSWQSKAWILERKYYKRWGNKERVEVEGRVKVTKDTDLTQLSEEDLLNALDDAKKKGLKNKES